jgi:hypothetical protein
MVKKLAAKSGAAFDAAGTQADGGQSECQRGKPDGARGVRTNLPRARPAHGGAKPLDRKFRSAVRKQKSVHLLKRIGKLRVAEAAEHRCSTSRLDHRAREALIFLDGPRGSVAPSA